MDLVSKRGGTSIYSTTLQGDAKYHKMLQQRQRLPAFEMQEAIVKAVRHNQVCMPEEP